MSSCSAAKSALAVAILMATALLADTQTANACSSKDGSCPVIAEAAPRRSDATHEARRPPPNTEMMTAADSHANGRCKPGISADLPFAISVDGAPLGSSSDAGNIADSQRCTDVALSKADVQVRYDALAVKPALDVIAAPDAALRGDGVIFATYTNYALWLDRGEIRIFAKGDTVRQKPLAILPVSDGKAHWNTPTGHSDEVTYVLRVYDTAGRFDETAPRILKLADYRGGRSKAGDLKQVYGGNTREVRNIPVSGGAVLVSGRQLAPGEHVRVLGIPVPVDNKGDFATQQILSPGPHQVEVAIMNERGKVAEFSRSVTIPDNDWFYVALADITGGRSSGNSAPAALLNPDKKDEYTKKYYVNGRLAFYLKGKVKGEYLLTAAADTRDQPLRHLFTGFDSKDPRYLLRNLDPNRYYPVYGDDSTLVEDAPTRGKFFVRIARGDSHLMWGNFKTSINGTEFVRYSRGLYGARAHVETDAATSHGEKRGEVEAFAAEPGTIGARDVFRGTGGSLYYLRRQNITQGSERLSIEIRDRNTGLVLKSKTLVAKEDYEINYIQGRVVLRNPLASVADDDFIVQTGTLSGHEQYLVATYEFTSSVTAADDRVAGGRASYWLGDHVRVGVTGYDQTEPGRNQRLYGSDITLRYKPGTYVKVEGARSEGPGGGEAVSIDGGFRFDQRATSGRTADAWRIEAAADLAEVMPGREGRLAAFWQHKDRDFSGPGQLAINRAMQEAGVKANVKLSDRLEFRAKADDKQDEFRHYQAAEANFAFSANADWKIILGTKIDDNKLRTATNSATLNQAGRRTDVAVKVEYDSHEDWTAYVLGQATLDKSGTRRDLNRGGVGGSVRLTEKLTAKGEVTGGSGGLGAKVGTEYRLDDKRTIYLNYALDPDRTDIISRGGQGVLVTGARTRFADNVSVFGEERYRHGGGYSGLTHAYGLDFSPAKYWTTGLAFEAGELSDPLAGDIKRLAVSGTIGYAHDGLTYSGKVEYRNDETPASERDTYLMRNQLGVKMNPDWRFIGRFNGSYSTNSLGDFYDGEYLEAVTGFAYRPVDNDRLNMLFKYTYFYDLPSPGQLAPSGIASNFAQRSHVLSVDVAYDLLPWLTVGGKYAYRTGDLRDTTAAGDWFDSAAQLAIGRIDLHLVKQWDFVAELRHLEVDAARDSRTGALVAAYRHIGKNFKLGVGYNFTDFSDELTDLSHKRSGIFVNGVAKF